MTKRNTMMDPKHKNLIIESNANVQKPTEPISKMGKSGMVLEAIEYNEDGYRLGRDKEGYDTEGFDKHGRDRNGRSKNGWDIHYFNEDGIHSRTKTRFNPRGYDVQGFNEEGFDKEGFDKEGYDASGYDRWGFKRDGYNDRGFNRNGINKDTNDKYDADGYDIDGYNSYGFNAEKLHKKGYLRSKNQWEPDLNRDESGADYWGFKEGDPINVRTRNERDSDGYDYQGFNEQGIDREGFGRDGFNEQGIDREGFGRDGFNEQDIDREGFGRDGFNEQGIDREGYNREGKDSDGYTREYNANFNQFGVDKSGHLKNGDLDQDVAIALDFVKSGLRSHNEYATEKNLDLGYVKKRIKMARKKCPNIDEIIKDILQTGNKMRTKVIADDCSKVISGEINPNDLWEKHPKMSIVDVVGSFLHDSTKKKDFSEKIIDSVALDSENIERNTRIFSCSKYDINAAIKGLEDFRKIYSAIPVDGSKEDILAKRENTKKLHEIEKYLRKYENCNINSLIGSKYSKDGGQTWIEFTKEAIDDAKKQLKEKGRLICNQTIKDYLMKQ